MDESGAGLLEAGRQSLEALAREHCIEPAYDDIWGQRHRVSDDGLRALLGEVGVQAGSDEEVAAALARQRWRRWNRLAEPVLAVSLPAERLRVELRLPRDVGANRVGWRFVPEHGEAREGEAELDALALLEDTEIDGLRHEARLLELEPELQAGYHRLELQVGDRHAARVLVIVAPPRCFEPPFLAAGGRVWGLAVQLYGLRSERNWGVGDFGDLSALVDVAASRGASAIGLNPLHARFTHDPDRVSPYAPSSRLWLDVLALDVEAIDDLSENEALRRRVRSPEFRERLQALRSEELVDYRGVSAIKHEVLGELYRHFRQEHLAQDTSRAASFRRFQRSGGRALRRHALFEALQQWLHSEDPSIWGWQVWPEPWRGADEDALREFERERIEQIEYHEYLQWQADAQLAAVAGRCREHRMAIGLYLDLAVSVDRSGSDCWSFSDCYASSASVGAPPDEFNPIGQDWGLPPLIPEALRACGHEPFVLGLRANMRHAGALRIDHVMGLMRLYWVPPGATAREGGYVGYPVDEMLAIVRLESHRNRCMVVGEDLGTVPDAIRAALSDAGVLSCRLLYFERDADGGFLPPQAYPRDALVSIGTHDLPTLAGWWSGQDLHLRGTFGLFPDAEMQQAQFAGRAQDRRRLVAALRREGLIEAGGAIDSGDAVDTGEAVDIGDAGEGESPRPGPALVDAVHGYLARTPASLMLVQPEDWLDVVDQNNVPGTVDEHPNWRRKLPLALAPGVGIDPGGERLAAVLAAAGRGCAQAARIPLSTCRLQLNGDFDFGAAREILPYLSRLGMGDIYCSPAQCARPGSRHGYDVVDPRRISPELGGESGFDALSAGAHRRGMGVLLDIVPNHMAVLAADNAWWQDVLEHGQASAYARFFDIDWHPPNPALDGKLLIPVLGDHYGSVLERGELVLRFDGGQGRFSMAYYEHELPIDPRESASILRRALAEPAVGPGPAAASAFRALIERIEGLPPRAAPEGPADPGLGGRSGGKTRAAAAAGGKARAMQRDVAGNGGDANGGDANGGDVSNGDARSCAQAGSRAAAALECRRELVRLVADSQELRAAIDAAVAALNEESPQSRDALDALMERQAWRMAYWRVASDEINYRRFFDVNELAGLRVEDPVVFEATHELVLELVASGRVDGLRIDHSDGLYDPGAYFARLQAACARRRGVEPPAEPPRARASITPASMSRRSSTAAPVVWRPIYVVVEKISAAYERLPAHWPVHGTTGYRFATLAVNLFVDRAAKDRVDRTWRAFTGERGRFEDISSIGRQLVLRSVLASDLTMLAAELSRIAAADRRTRDYSLGTLRRALADVAAQMPVYRTYIAERVSSSDRRYVEWAVGAATRRSRTADVTVFGFVRDALLGRAPPGASPALCARTLAFARRFQQFTSPVMAKGVEDTALYRFNRLVSLNDVGSEPDSFGLTIRAFHAANADRAENWPHALIALSTHDSKRSADMRARIDVISELPSQWRLLLRRWRTMNRRRRVVLRTGRRGSDAAPSRNDEYLLYQVLLGSFRPDRDTGDALAAYTERIDAYMIKAAREAKQETSWVNPDPDYERALSGFVRALLAPGDSNAFLADLAAQVEQVAWFGALNSLAMAAIHLTAPGVPDLYRGNECFDFSLVDPDNRRPVDFAAHAGLLERIEGRVAEAGIEATAAELSRDPRADEAKLFLSWRLLQLRRAEPALFRDGDYRPLQVSGAAAEHLVAYARCTGAAVVVVIVARLFVKLLGAPGRLPEGDVWGDEAVLLDGLVEGELVDRLSGRYMRVEEGRLGVASVFAGFPAVVLTGRRASAA